MTIVRESYRVTMRHRNIAGRAQASRRCVVASLAALACSMLPVSTAFARDGSLDLVNALRTHDCAQPLSGAEKLRGNARLDAAASDIMQGGTIDEALKRADFRVTRSVVIRVTGDIDDVALRRMLRERYCESITDPRLTTAGLARANGEVAVVLARPFAPPRAEDANKVAKEVLQLVNEARA